MSMQVLVESYKALYLEYHGMRPRLSQTKQKQLVSLSETLQQHNIDPAHYVKVSFNLWSEWCEERSMPPVPINVLCSEAAVERFRRLDPTPEHVVMQERLITVEISAYTHAIREMLKGRTYEEVQVEIDGEMRRYFPNWWYKMRDENTPFYQAAQLTALQHVAWFYGVQYKDGDTYPTIAERTARKWKDYV